MKRFLTLLMISFTIGIALQGFTFREETPCPAEYEVKEPAPLFARFELQPDQTFEVPTGGPTSPEVLAPDETGPGTFAWFKQHWGALAAILVGVYELVARYFPTVRSVSILSWLIRIVAYIIPDRAKDGKGQFVGEKRLR